MAQSDAHLATVKCICKTCERITFDVRRANVIGENVNNFLAQAATAAFVRDKTRTVEDITKKGGMIRDITGSKNTVHVC